MSNIAEQLLKELNTRPQPRGYLCWVLECTDSELRAAVRELRDNGYNVASNSHTNGYWLGDKDDAKRTIRELRAKAYTLIKRANALEKGLDKGQIKWTEEGQAEWPTTVRGADLWQR